MKVWIKKRGRTGTVYLDGDRPLPINDMEHEPMGFPFAARMEELLHRFSNYEPVIIEDTKEPPVSGVVISDNRVLMAVPEAKREMGEQKLVRQPDMLQALVPNGMMTVHTGQAEALATRSVTPVTDIERAVCDKFRDNIKRWHYASGKEKKQLAQDLEAVASFLIDMAPHLEAVLGRIKDEETLAKKRFQL